MKSITKIQIGNAGEWLVAAELALAGVPTFTTPTKWPGYDLIACPVGRDLQKISVKTRTYKKSSSSFVAYKVKDAFDWLAIVLLPGGSERHRRFFLVPRSTCDATARRDRVSSKAADDRYWPIPTVASIFAAYENNFLLLEKGAR